MDVRLLTAPASPRTACPACDSRTPAEAASCDGTRIRSWADHCLVAESGFDEWIAQRYETLWPELFDEVLIAATVSVLAGLADTGPALEFGVGTGRVAVPLSRTGIEVHGIDL